MVDKDENDFDWTRLGTGRRSACADCIREGNRVRTQRHRDATNPNPVVVQLPLRAHQECRVCRQVKPIDEFYRSARTVSGIEGKCKVCRRARMTEQYRAEGAARGVRRRAGRTPEQVAEWRGKFRAYALFSKFKLTVEQYDDLLVAQNGRCALCGGVERKVHHLSGRELALAVDHDHGCCPGVKSCGHCIRGLLCYDCNLMIGKIEAKPELAKRFFDYLSRRVVVDDVTSTT